jgi:hypothetical protein
MRGCIAPRQWTVNKKWVIEENERKREASTGLRDRANGIIDDKVVAGKILETAFMRPISHHGMANLTSR